VTLVDSGQAMARAAERELSARGLRGDGSGEPALRCFVTDEARFAELGARFLGHPLDGVEKIDLA
jgi:hypothetical protein